MRAAGMSGRSFGWKAGSRSAAELKEAATHFERAVALHLAPAGKAYHARNAAWCRSEAEAKAARDIFATSCTEDAERTRLTAKTTNQLLEERDAAIMQLGT
eukprot:scaffold38089_cov64-Phaeocystis_antarctica.AAC.3